MAVSAHQSVFNSKLVVVSHDCHRQAGVNIDQFAVRHLHDAHTRTHSAVKVAGVSHAEVLTLVVGSKELISCAAMLLAVFS